MKTDKGISLVLPGYNEEESVEAAVRESLDILRSFTDRYEIILIDDGSTDGTGGIADRLGAEFPAVRVIHNPVNLGVGSGVLIGFKAARYELVTHNGMDRPFDLKDLERILPLFPAADAVVVQREDRSAHSPYRRLTSVVNYWLIRLLFGVRLYDFNFVQVYKKEVLEAVTVTSRSAAFVTPELLIRAHDLGFKLAQIKLPFHPRKKGEVHYGSIRDILWALGDMLFFLRKRREARS